MFPIAILRALAAGLPVVATRVGGIDAMVEEKRTGFLTSPADPGALAAGLMDLLRNPAKRARMGSAGYRLFLRKYHADEMAERVEEVYRYTLSQGPGAR
jgi:glycosyltransferase involved in cell wall biosynthesis